LIGRDASGGAVFVNVNSLLQGLKGDLDNQQSWNHINPLNNGYSIGQIIEAGSNNFRHFDKWTVQWVKHKKFTKQQVNPLRPLQNVERIGISQFINKYLRKITHSHRW
jgi:hypothetical protein